VASTNLIDRVTDDHDDHHDHHDESGTMAAIRIAVVAFCAAAVWFEFPDASPPVLVIGEQLYLPFSFYGVIGVVFGGWPILKGAFENIIERKMTMELSMSMAIVGALYAGFFFGALWFTFFVLVAEVLEGMTIERGRRAIRELLELLPREVSVRRAGALMEIHANDLVVGDTILVAPGARIPVDGAVVGGHSFVDESRITGESLPAEKTPGTAALAGTINQSGVLEIRAERLGRDTSYGKIIEAVERAERSRAPVQRLADQLAAYIVYVAVGFCLLEYYFSKSVIEAVSVIIVAGACGVAAGTPLAILGGIGRAARLGAIIKGGIHLETLGRVDTVVLDKTGTLTFGMPEVQKITPAEGIPAEVVLETAVTAELRSEHPFGKAIIRHAGPLARQTAEPQRFNYVPGRGILAVASEATLLVGNEAWMRDNHIAVPANFERSGNEASQVFVARDGRLLGAIEVADRLRPEAQEAVDALKRMRIRTILLTGDTPAVAESVARRLGIEEVEAQLLPEMKVARMKDLVAQGRIVAMVGDGVNDAPALTAANVGVAMGSGTDVARESADIVLLGNDLARFVDTVAVSRQARRIIWFNFAGTVVVDVVGIALIFMGYVGPMLAAIIHTASEFAFIMNSARLLPLTSRARAPKYTGAAAVTPPSPARAGTFRLSESLIADAPVAASPSVLSPIKMRPGES
jgi:Cd2+/Zn2+-exporting ATPase/Cu+-exporting ATPase